MKKCTCLLLALFVNMAVFAQVEPLDSTGWQIAADVNLYFIPQDFFVLPVIRADNNKLHLEARYNYEDRQTFSAWVGYNFKGGKKVEYAITPMIGGVVGLSNGVAPGFEMTFTLNRFELYSESEAYFDFETSENNFLYTWTDLTYSANDWLWFGLSAQRTRLYETDLDIQRGALIGAGLKKWEFSAYVYNLGFDEPFMLLSVSKSF